ncbi:hypothetical protein U1Q18_039801 [Sarracenia purpurea var. burkii]
MGLEERAEVNGTIFEEMELVNRVAETVKEAGAKNSNCRKKKEIAANAAGMEEEGHLDVRERDQEVIMARIGGPQGQYQAFSNIVIVTTVEKIEATKKLREENHVKEEDVRSKQEWKYGGCMRMKICNMPKGRTLRIIIPQVRRRKAATHKSPTLS